MQTKPQICPFCSSSILQSVFYTRGEFLVVYNIAPALPGHSLVIPRRHVSSLLELDKQELTDFMITAREAVLILLSAFKTDSFDWSVQEKPEAGQSIEHLHLHIVPRLKGDLKNPGDWYPLLQTNDDAVIDSLNRTKLKPGELKSIIDNLKITANMLMQSGQIGFNT